MCAMACEYVYVQVVYDGIICACRALSMIILHEIAVRANDGIVLLCCWCAGCGV